MTPIGAPRVRALEFFSGIGGMHYGLEWAAADFEIVAAFDINPTANKCYQHNFNINPIEKNIQNLNPATFDKFNANCWLMSPPCQPYTRTGKQLDHEDPRALGFLFLMDVLAKMEHPPTYIFIENVVNFEIEIHTVGEFVEENVSFSHPPFKIPERLLKSRGSFDPLVVAVPSHFRTSCFTKAYGRHGVASGAFLQTKGFDEDTAALLNARGAVDKLGLRLFTPTEIARIHGFPIDDKAPKSLHVPKLDGERHSFSFPEGINIQQQWRLLGNSMCVVVVGEIIRQVLLSHE
ncbi:hypothetical protein BASA50_006885 [Batrachochytrium salamandrivorans]|uniref:DNA (Cytosine-5-)-methyltransferase n=1 Tax=Batrachochytrium salamandrivorans TaxID=1357716 RepID=A0ABQ8F9J5_9FUNG|nr:hypothetical protein BASA60_005078 [Batrachochytrium salamandrivorans]KAH6593974.1 hypothetical protein BASA50_006885 [Batrachochytrium salamandrivorans]KAH6602135.1 hypothetical protein BASA61_001428 [Batrachochytrium salamandrivorans]